MFSVRKFLLASLFVLSAMVVVPISASAELLCVNVTPCGGGLVVGTPEATIQDALEAAANNGEEDTIRVGSSALPYSGPFAYNDTEKVTLLGVGATKPTLQDAGGGLAVFQLLGNAASKIENFRLVVPAKASGTALHWEGIAEDLEVSYAGANAEVRGVLPQGAATLRDSSIDIVNTGALGFGLGIEAAFVTGSGLSLENAEITGTARGGVSAVAAGARVTITRSTITADRSAVQLGGAGAEVTASQSVLHSGHPVAADGVVGVLSGGSFTGDHVTLHGDGTARGVVVDSSGAAPADNASITLKNSIISNVAVAGLSAESGASLSTTYTLLPSALQTLNGGSTTPGTGTITGVPNYANAVGGDFRLTAPQASIDAGDPGDVTPVDRAGNPRLVNGDAVPSVRSDLGAFEYQAVAPIPTITAPAKIALGSAGTFSAAATDPDPGDSVTFAWEFGDGTASGASASHAFATLGVKTVTVTATDQIGRKSSASVAVDVVDATAPELKITGVKLNKKRTALAANLSCPASESSCSFKYVLTTAKKLKVGKKKKYVTLAKAGKASATGGKTAKLQIKLNNSAKKLLAKGSVKVKLQVTSSDAAQNSTTKTVQYTAKQGKTGSAKK